MIWSLVVIAFVLAGLWFYRYSLKREAAADFREEDEQIKRLIKEGVSVTVDLSQCEIRTGRFQIEQHEHVGEMSAGDVVSAADDKKDSKTADHALLIYTHTLDNGQTVRFFGPTSKDKKTLQLLCAMEGTTTIYYDRGNPQVYYFDLRFLD